jgi:hypothetical protein
MPSKFNISTPAPITFVSVVRPGDGWADQIAAIRVDAKTLFVLDVFNASVGVSTVTRWVGNPALVEPMGCVAALSQLLEDAVLAAWDVEQTIADLDEVLGEAGRALRMSDERPIDVASLVRPFAVVDKDDVEPAAKWAGLPRKIKKAIEYAGAAHSVTRCVFELAHLERDVAHASHCPLSTTH